MDEELVRRIRNRLSSAVNVTLFEPGRNELESYCRSGYFSSQRSLLIYRVNVIPRGTKAGINIESCSGKDRQVRIQFTEEIIVFDKNSEAFELYHSSPERDWSCHRRMDIKRPSAGTERLAKGTRSAGSIIRQEKPSGSASMIGESSRYSGQGSRAKTHNKLLKAKKIPEHPKRDRDNRSFGVCVRVAPSLLSGISSA